MKTLRSANEEESVISAYQIQPSPARTGACAVIISNHDRSLCTTLRAAEMFTPDHLAKPEIASMLSGAKYFYIEGYFLTHGIESALEIAKAASSRGKTVVLNLSAPFIPQFFKVQLDELLPHVDILIGNESEAAALGEAAGMGVSLGPSSYAVHRSEMTLTFTGCDSRTSRYQPGGILQIQCLPSTTRHRHPRCRLNLGRLFLPLNLTFQP